MLCLRSASVILFEKSDDAREEAAYSPFNTFTSSPCTNSLPQTTWPVVSALSWPSMPETVPPDHPTANVQGGS